MTATLRIGLLVTGVALALDVAVVLDANRRVGSADPASARAVVRLAGTADLALSSNARWLRHPSHVEPWAAVADQPATLDTEPAGAILGPPRR